MKMTPKQWAEGNALLAKYQNKELEGVPVLVLKRAILAGLDHKNTTGWSAAGDIVMMKTGRHLRGLEGKGIVTRHFEVPPFPTRN